MKFLLVSDSPTLRTGLGKSIANIGRVLRGWGHECQIAGHGHDGRPLLDDGTPCWSWRREDRHSLERAIAGAKPAVVVLLGDAWHFKFLHALRDSLERGGACPTFILVLTVDCAPFVLTAHNERVLDSAHHLCATTPFGVRVLTGEETSDMDSRVPMRYVVSPCPLGIDPAIYHSAPMARVKARRRWPTSRPVIGWVGANQYRKHPGEAVMALAKLRQQGLRPVLWMKTERRGDFDLFEVAQHLGLQATQRPLGESQDPDVVIASDYWTEADMASAYRRMDLLLSTATAGAPELPLLEARACGTPTVAMNTCCFPETADYVVDVGPYTWVVPTVRHPQVDPEATAEVLHWLLGNGGTVGSNSVPGWDEAGAAIVELAESRKPDWVPGVTF